MALGLREIVRRFGHSRATVGTITQLEDNRHRAIELGLHWDETLPEGRYAALAQTHLEMALVYANKAVTYAAADEPPLPDHLPPGDLLG